MDITKEEAIKILKLWNIFKNISLVNSLEYEEHYWGTDDVFYEFLQNIAGIEKDKEERKSNNA